MKPLPCLLQSYPLPSKMVLFMSPWLLACSQRLWLPHSTLFSADAVFPTGGLHHLHGIEDLLCRLALHRDRVAYGRGSWEALWWLLWRTWTYGTPYTITAEGFSSCKAAEGDKDLAFNFHSLIFPGPFFWASPLCHGKNLFTSSFLCPLQWSQWVSSVQRINDFHSLKLQTLLKKTADLAPFFCICLH